MLILAPKINDTAMAAEAVGASTVTKAPWAMTGSIGSSRKNTAVETVNWNNNNQKSNIVKRIFLTSNELNEKNNIKKMK